MTTTPINLNRPDGKGLAAGTLGLWGSTVIGLASTAPVYSLVASLGFVVLAVGAQAPIAFVIAFIPMLFIAFAYRELNNDVPDCGTTFTWGTKAFGPWVGWMGGWGVAVAGMVVLANLAQIAGIYFWALIDGVVRTSEDALLADNVPLVTATGVVFIAAMTWVSWRGVEIGERIQNVLLGIQYLALVIFVVAALWHFFAGTAPDATPFSWEWFNPFAFTDWGGFIEAVLLALFIYWGWDTCLALNEETKDPKRIPGRAALLTTVILLITYVGVTVAAMMYAGLGERRHGPRQRGQRRRLLPRDQGRPAGPGRVGARGRRDDLGHLVDPDHDPSDRARDAGDGRLQGPAQAVRRGAPALQDPVVLDARDGGRRDRLLHRHDADQRQHPAGLDPVARASRSPSTTASPVSPASGTSVASCSTRRGTSSTGSSSRCSGR